MDIYFGTLAESYYKRWPLTLIDIGARGGLQANWKQARRHLRLVGFEPDAAEHERLAAAANPERVLYINAAVWREAAQVRLNVGRDPGTSSLLQPNAAFLGRFPRAERFDVVREVEVSADRLDRLLEAKGVKDPDFLKIDTQGAELAILEGARETLARSILGVEVEVQLAPLYREQPSFGEIDDVLRSLGFQLFDMRPSYWKRAAGRLYGGPKGQLVFADVLYLKTEEDIDRLLSRVAAGDERASKLLRALGVCVLYGYVDYAIELFEANRSLLHPELAAAVNSQLRSEIPLSARLPHFRGRGTISQFFYRLHRALFPTVDRWASGGRHLGNLD